MNQRSNDDFDLDFGDEPPEEYVHLAKRMSLNIAISDAFTRFSASELRQWYVENFVFDTTNVAVLPELGGNHELEMFQSTDTWRNIEHAAIGTRLLFKMDPDKIVIRPSLTEPEQWRDEFGLVDTILQIVKPWESVRYDPHGENWYQVVAPGQWLRHGKGKPSEQLMERFIQKWFKTISPLNSEAFKPWQMETAKYAADDLANRILACGSSYRSFIKKATSHTRIRQVLESLHIMRLDTGTLNQTRSIAPFSNGAVALVDFQFTDVQFNTHKVRMGEMLPLDVDYMVTNANPMPWADYNNRLPGLFEDIKYEMGDFVHLDELQDELLLNGCPTYWAFLTHAFPETEERSAFLRLLGAAMFGSNIKIVAAMIGEPNAGKDTVMNWLNYLMPGQVATLPFSAFTANGDEDRGFAPLRGCRVATVSGEVGENRGNKLMAEKIKAVASGGGKLRVAEKYEKPTDIWFDGMLIMQGNSVPAISGGDRALYTNRIVAVEFQHPFGLTSHSFEHAYRSEAPQFALVLFLNYMQYVYAGGGMQGIRPPESWKLFAKEFAEVSNVNGFIESCITKSPKYIPTTQFHAALSQLAQRYGSPRPIGPYFWPKRLRALGFSFKQPTTIKKQVTVDGVRSWVYYLDVDASKSDGMFTQEQWERILKDAAVNA